MNPMKNRLFAANSAATKRFPASERDPHRINSGFMVGLACLGLFAGQTVLAARGVVNVLDHGAVGDGAALNTTWPGFSATGPVA